jgi:hypothetical protein
MLPIFMLGIVRKATGILEIDHIPLGEKSNKSQKIIPQLSSDKEVLLNMPPSVLTQPVGIFFIGQ